MKCKTSILSISLFFSLNIFAQKSPQYTFTHPAVFDEHFLQNQEDKPQFEISSFKESRIDNTDFYEIDLIPVEDKLPSCSIFYDTNSLADGTQKLMNLAAMSTMAASLVALKHIPTKEDKLRHYMAGYFIASTVSGGVKLLLKKDSKNYALKAFLAGLGSSLIVGAGKEIFYDKMMGKGTPDVKDAVVTALGGLNGAITIDFVDVQKLVFKNKKKDN